MIAAMVWGMFVYLVRACMYLPVHTSVEVAGIRES